MKRNLILTAALLAAPFLFGCETAPAGSAGAGGGTGSTGGALSGIAIAIDGDSIMIGVAKYDLWGIDAPSRNNRDGWFARAALDDLIGPNGSLTCSTKVKRRSGRDKVICSNGRVGDIGRAMLQNGWAVVDRDDMRFSAADAPLADAYDRAERLARQKRAGLWSGM